MGRGRCSPIACPNRARRDCLPAANGHPPGDAPFSNMSIEIKELAFVALAVTDVPAARKFYEGWLGLKPAHEIEFAPAKWWIEYDVAGVALAISNASPETWPRCSSVALEVADLDDACASARASGIPVTNEVMEFPPCRMFTVKDPDGNEITLHKRKA